MSVPHFGHVTDGGPPLLQSVVLFEIIDPVVDPVEIF